MADDVVDRFRELCMIGLVAEDDVFCVATLCSFAVVSSWCLGSLRVVALAFSGLLAWLFVFVLLGGR